MGTRSFLKIDLRHWGPIPPPHNPSNVTANKHHSNFYAHDDSIICNNPLGLFSGLMGVYIQPTAFILTKTVKNNLGTNLFTAEVDSQTLFFLGGGGGDSTQCPLLLTFILM